MLDRGDVRHLIADRPARALRRQQPLLRRQLVAHRPQRRPGCIESVDEGAQFPAHEPDATGDTGASVRTRVPRGARRHCVRQSGVEQALSEDVPIDHGSGIAPRCGNHHQMRRPRKRVGVERTSVHHLSPPTVIDDPVADQNTTLRTEDLGDLVVLGVAVGDAQDHGVRRRGGRAKQLVAFATFGRQVTREQQRCCLDACRTAAERSAAHRPRHSPRRAIARPACATGRQPVHRRCRRRDRPAASAS